MLLPLLFALAVTGASPAGEWYVGTNPASLASFSNTIYTRGAYGLVSNLEYGPSLLLGRYLERNLALEGRISAGPVNQTANAYQAHAGVLYFPWEERRSFTRGLYGGGALRLWDLHYTSVEDHYLNLAAGIHAGYWLQSDDGWFLDVRLSQLIAVATYALEAGSGVGTAWALSADKEFSPVLPLAALNVGVRFR